MKKNLLSMDRRLGAQSPRSVMDGRVPRASRMFNYGMEAHRQEVGLLAEVATFIAVCVMTGWFVVWATSLI